MDEILKNLEVLGFTQYESKVFCVLFEGNLCTATEIANKAGIPRSSSYDILKIFTQKGICNEIQTSSVAKYEMIDPRVVQDKIAKEINDNHSKKVSKLKDSFDTLAPLYKSKQNVDEKVDVELIKGFNKHRFAKFAQLFESTKEEFLLMNRLEAKVDSDLDASSQKFIDNGGVIKTIYEASFDFKIREDGEWKIITPEKLPDFIQKLSSGADDVRLAEKVHQNMAIFDRKVVYISLVDPTIPRHNRSDIIIKNQNYAESMAEYFNTCWNNAYTTEEFKNKVLKQG
jgi:sugar-specific transcriptional regulator TrmB